jgi:predicted transcriptional regulator
VPNLAKNRDRICIVASVLEAINGGASKTRIMNLANLSFSLLEKYLNLVVETGFVRTEGKKYKLTESGYEFLKSYQHFVKKHSLIADVLGDLDKEYKELAHLIKKSPLKDTFILNNKNSNLQLSTKNKSNST